jgi:hypothetical protein
MPSRYNGGGAVPPYRPSLQQSRFPSVYGSSRVEGLPCCRHGDAHRPERVRWRGPKGLHPYRLHLVGRRRRAWSSKAFPRATTMVVCVDNHCGLRWPVQKYLREAHSLYRPRRIYYEGRAVHGEGPYAVRVEIKDSAGNVLLRRERSGVKLRRRYPNGKGCGAPCFNVLLALDFNSRKLAVRTPA